MKTRSIVISCLLGLLFASPTVQAGQAIVLPLEKLVKQTALIAVVEVKKVTRVEIPTDSGDSHVYVAEAEAKQTLKSDYAVIKPNRKLAIVGSTVPRSSAVWQPIEEGRYLAFLNREQGHYHYGMLIAFRKIDEDNKVPWYDRRDGKYEFIKLDLDAAIKRIKAELD